MAERVWSEKNLVRRANRCNASSFEVRAVKEARSRRPITLSLEIFGDRWTLLVLRDVVVTDRSAPDRLAAAWLRK
jgi:DNA-binding HxlR family transcriptional regulator